MTPLWRRALAARDLERTAARREAQRAGGRKVGFSGRRYPVPVVGQRYGDWTITAVLGRGHDGRSDLRLRGRCSCGVEADRYEYNWRLRTLPCRHAVRLELA